MDLLNQYLEDKRKEEEENRNPFKIELDRLDNDKADKLEFLQLKQMVEEVKQVLFLHILAFIFTFFLIDS